VCRLCQPCPCAALTNAANTGFAMSGTTTAIVAWSLLVAVPRRASRPARSRPLAQSFGSCASVRADPVGIAECTGSRGQRHVCPLATVGQGRPHGTSSVDGDTHRAAPCASLSRNWQTLPRPAPRPRRHWTVRDVATHVAGVLELYGRIARGGGSPITTIDGAREFNDHTVPRGGDRDIRALGRPCRSERRRLTCRHRHHPRRPCRALARRSANCQCPRCLRS